MWQLKGDTLLESRQELEKAVQEYLHFSEETQIKTAPLDIDSLREFLVSDIDESIKVHQDLSFSENFSTKISNPIYETAAAVQQEI